MVNSEVYAVWNHEYSISMPNKHETKMYLNFYWRLKDHLDITFSVPFGGITQSEKCKLRFRKQ